MHLPGLWIELDQGVAVRAHRKAEESTQRRVNRAAEGIDIAYALSHCKVCILGVFKKHLNAVGVVVHRVVVVDLRCDLEHLGLYRGPRGNGFKSILADEVHGAGCVCWLESIATGQHLRLYLESAISDDQPVASLSNGVH
ncbi:unannotated protein [freshwater metagenome]|uniref:Unannotated protein n=1 Tax=freshwater metagenome TaxID=449393 RepID=A0A6J7HWE8_9ZZZZ